jgi:hypothetical protein
MSTPLRFDEVPEAIEKLPGEDQETLIAIVQRRRLAVRRAALAKDLQDARQEFKNGGCQARTAKELVDEILS